MRRTPCPDCGETATLELLRYQKNRLEVMKRNKTRQARQAWQATIGAGRITITSGSGVSTGMGGAVTISGGVGGSSSFWHDLEPVPDKMPSMNEFRVDMGGRPNGAECCIGCFRFYNPCGDEELQSLRAEIEQLRHEVLPPLELLAEAAGDDALL